MKLERVQVGVKIFDDGHTIHAEPVFEDVLVESPFKLMVKNSEFWICIIAILFFTFGLIIATDKWVIILHTILLIYQANRVKDLYDYCDAIRYPKALGKAYPPFS